MWGILQTKEARIYSATAIFLFHFLACAIDFCARQRENKICLRGRSHGHPDRILCCADCNEFHLKNDIPSSYNFSLFIGNLFRGSALEADACAVAAEEVDTDKCWHTCAIRRTADKFRRWRENLHRDSKRGLRNDRVRKRCRSTFCSGKRLRECNSIAFPNKFLREDRFVPSHSPRIKGRKKEKRGLWWKGKIASFYLAHIASFCS